METLLSLAENFHSRNHRRSYFARARAFLGVLNIIIPSSAGRVFFSGDALARSTQIFDITRSP